MGANSGTIRKISHNQVSSICEHFEQIDGPTHHSFINIFYRNGRDYALFPKLVRVAKK